MAREETSNTSIDVSDALSRKLDAKARGKRKAKRENWPAFPFSLFSFLAGLWMALSSARFVLSSSPG
jgi:hypothetical protein